MDRRAKRSKKPPTSQRTLSTELPCPFLSLPHELHIAITALLDTQSKKHVRQVNHYFHRLVSLQIFQIQLDDTVSDHFAQLYRSTRKTATAHTTNPLPPSITSTVRTNRTTPSTSSAQSRTNHKQSIPSKSSKFPSLRSPSAPPRPLGPPEISKILPALRHATILPSFYGSLRKVLPHLPSTLTHITYRCPPRSPSHLHVLSLCPSLSSLELLHYQGATLSPLSSLSSLTHLKLKAPSALQCISSLSTLTTLVSLLIWITEDVVAATTFPPVGLHTASLAPLASLPYLRGLELNLMESQGGASLSCLTQLASITLLEAYPATLAAVLTLTNLRELNIPNIVRPAASLEWHHHPSPSFPHLTALVLPLSLATAPSCPVTSTRLCHLLLDTSSSSPGVWEGSDASDSEPTELPPPAHMPHAVLQLQGLPLLAQQQQQQHGEEQVHGHGDQHNQQQQQQPQQNGILHHLQGAPAGAAAGEVAGGAAGAAEMAGGAIMGAADAAVPAAAPADIAEAAALPALPTSPASSPPSSSTLSPGSAAARHALSHTLRRFPHHPLAHLGLIIRGKSRTRCRALLQGLVSSPWQPPHLALAMIPGTALISNMTTLAPLTALTTLHIRVVEDMTDRRIASWNRMCVQEGEQRQIPQSVVQAAREWLAAYDKRKTEEQVVRELVGEAIQELCPKMPQLRHVLFSKHEF